MKGIMAVILSLKLSETENLGQLVYLHLRFPQTNYQMIHSNTIAREPEGDITISLKMHDMQLS